MVWSAKKCPPQAVHRGSPEAGIKTNRGRPASARARPGAGNQSGTMFQLLPAIMSAGIPLRNAPHDVPALNAADPRDVKDTAHCNPVLLRDGYDVLAGFELLNDGRVTLEGSAAEVRSRR
jgi:hypothetical protein